MRSEMRFLKVPYMLLAAPLTLAARVVYADLLDRPEPRSPKVATVAAAVNLPQRTVERAIAELRRYGVLQTQRSGRSSTYLLLPCESAVENLWKSRGNLELRTAKLADQIRQSGGSLPYYFLDSLTRRVTPPAAASPRARDKGAARRQPRRERQTPPLKTRTRKPPAAETAPRVNGQDWWPHEPAKVAAVRASLQRLGVSCRLPPPDDGIVRQVLDLARGASAAAIEHRIVDLYRARRFDDMHSWGLVPVALKPWFKARAAAR